MGRRLLLAALALGVVLAACPAAGAQVAGDQSADRWVTIAAALTFRVRVRTDRR